MRSLAHRGCFSPFAFRGLACLCTTFLQFIAASHTGSGGCRRSWKPGLALALPGINSIYALVTFSHATPVSRFQGHQSVSGMSSRLVGYRCVRRANHSIPLRAPVNSFGTTCGEHTPVAPGNPPQGLTSKSTSLQR